MKEKLFIILLSVAEILVGILLLINPVGLTTWIILAHPFTSSATKQVSTLSVLCP